MVMPPSGTITFLFTDIEGSTRRWDEQPEAMRDALARHDTIIRQSIERHGGYVFKTVGDGFYAAFSTALPALAAAVDAQRALAAEPWGDARPGPVRMALHTGAVDERAGDYFGAPLNHLARLKEAAHGGQVLLSGATAELVRDRLPDGVQLRDLGEHRLRDVARPWRVYQLAIWGLPADFPPLALADDRPSGLPVPLTSLVGREADIEQVTSLLSTARLLTLTGPGGVGKTRLAVAVAERLHQDYADGVVFVDLSSVSDSRLVASTIAQVLGVQEREAGTVFDSLQSFLREKRLLLVLDNFEQVVEAAPLLRGLLSAATGLTLLVTSRVLLRLSGEREYAVPPLSLPDEATVSDLATVWAVPAMALFLQRAQDAQPDLDLTGDDAGAVAEICTRLDGLPLAIELAAARSRILPPRALLARLGQRLSILTSGARDLPARQQTLRDTIGWSYDLLGPAEQLLFRRLSVFVGGCTLAAAEAICGADGGLGVEVLDRLASLVEKNLLRREVGPEREPRFGMLETIREYALERLSECGETDLARRQHRAYFLALVEEAAPKLASPEREPWLTRLEVEHDNLRAALAWSTEQRDAHVGVRLAGALQWFWYFRGHLREGYRWLTVVLALSGVTTGTAARATALAGAGWLGYEQGGHPETLRPLLEESIAIWRDLGDVSGLAHSLVFLGLVANRERDHTLARRYFDESVALFRASGDRWGLAHALFFSAAELLNGPTEGTEARPLLEESETIFRELGDAWGLAGSLSGLGILAWREGDAVAARSFIEESLALSRAVGDKWRIAQALNALGDIACGTGDSRRARGLLGESLALWWELGHREHVALVLVDLAAAATEEGDPTRAATLLAAADRLMREMGRPPLPIETEGFERAIGGARENLSHDAFASAWERGRALSLDAAVALALAQTEEPIAPL